MRRRVSIGSFHRLANAMTEGNSKQIWDSVLWISEWFKFQDCG